MDLSIKNTTREQRKQIIKNALAISVSGDSCPSTTTLEIAKEYVYGKIEDMQKKIIEMYKK